MQQCDNGLMNHEDGGSARQEGPGDLSEPACYRDVARAHFISDRQEGY
jgi:hypothetical protein